MGENRPRIRGRMNGNTQSYAKKPNFGLSLLHLREYLGGVALASLCICCVQVHVAVYQHERRAFQRHEPSFPASKHPHYPDSILRSPNEDKVIRQEDLGGTDPATASHWHRRCLRFLLLFWILDFSVLIFVCILHYFACLYMCF